MGLLSARRKQPIMVEFGIDPSIALAVNESAIAAMRRWLRDRDDKSGV